jgi:hypothetical protein
MNRVFCFVVFLVACAGNSTATTPDSGSGSGSGSGSLNPADCDAFAKNAIDAQTACGGSVPPNAQQILSDACKKGIQHASLCGGDPAGGLSCFRSEDASDWVCQLATIYPYCNNDLDAALGMYCLVKLGEPACASIACHGSLECPSGSSCNQVTQQCFSNDADCVGLPCDGSLDCPTGETCNTAEHACIHN